MARDNLPTIQKALVVQGPGKLSLQDDVAVPMAHDGKAIVKVHAVAINPVDAKILDFSPAVGAIHGHDFAGTIVALGSNVPSHLSLGDRVAGTVHGNNPRDHTVGAFAEYVAAEADLLLTLPDSMSFEQGATIGIGLGTALLCIYQELGIEGSLRKRLSAPSTDDAEFILVAGGSTATGTRTIQLLNLMGFRVIATASPSNAHLSLDFGAEKVFDYHLPDCAASIRAYTNNTLAYAIDCVSQADTTQMCYGAIGRAGGSYVSLEPYRDAVVATRALTIAPHYCMGLTIFGKEVALGGVYGREARPQDRAMANRMFPEVQKLLDEGVLSTHPVKALDGGLRGVMEGVETIRTTTSSGFKMVYAM